MATLRHTATLDKTTAGAFDGLRFIPSGAKTFPPAQSVVRQKFQGQGASNAERIQQAIARSEQDARLVNFFLSWWPFDLLRSLGHWLQCWGCAFAVRWSSDPAPDAISRKER